MYTLLVAPHCRNKLFFFLADPHFRINIDAHPERESYAIGSKVMLTCSAVPFLQTCDGNFTHNLRLRYSWYSAARGGLISYGKFSNATFVEITSYHPSSADYYCWVYLVDGYRYQSNDILLGIGRITLNVKSKMCTDMNSGLIIKICFQMFFRKLITCVAPLESVSILGRALHLQLNA